MVDYLPIHDSADNVGRAQGPTEPLAFGAAWLAARLHRVAPPARPGAAKGPRTSEEGQGAAQAMTRAGAILVALVGLAAVSGAVAHTGAICRQQRLRVSELICPDDPEWRET